MTSSQLGESGISGPITPRNSSVHIDNHSCEMIVTMASLAPAVEYVRELLGNLVNTGYVLSGTFAVAVPSKQSKNN